MKKLATGAITTGAGTLLYTVPTGMRTDVKDIVIVNTDTSGSASVSVHFVPVGGSATSSNKLLSNHTMAHSTYSHWSGTQTLNSGDFIQGIGTAATFTIHITGEEYRAGT